MFAKIEINFHALGQPEYGVFPLKGDWAVFYDLMLGKKLYLRHRFDQFRFDPRIWKLSAVIHARPFSPTG